MHKYIFLVLLIACWSCKSEKVASGTNDTGISITLSSLEKGGYSGMEKAQNMLIKSAEEWATVWKNLNQFKSPAPAKPVVDFEKEYVVAAFMGTKSNGGYGVNITEASLANDILTVKITHRKPGKNCISTMAIVQPYHIVTIDRTSIKEAVFTVEEKVNDCE